MSNAAAPRLPTPSNCLRAWRSASWRSPHVEAGVAFDPAVLAADRVVIEQKRMGDFLTDPPLAQKHQGIRAPRHPATRRRIARQRRNRLANFFAEDARLNPARNRIRPIGNRKNSLIFNESGYVPLGLANLNGSMTAIAVNAILRQASTVGTSMMRAFYCSGSTAPRISQRSRLLVCPPTIFCPVAARHKAGRASYVAHRAHVR